MKIQGYVGKSGAVAGNAQEYAVPVHLFREGRDTTGGNTNSFAATFTDCVFYDTSGDFNGAVSVDGNSSFKMPKTEALSQVDGDVQQLQLHWQQWGERGRQADEQ